MVENLKKTDLNAVDNNGRTALIAAVEKEDLKLLQLLLLASADTTRKDKLGRTAL
jgi:ankyrin repeat protein